MFPSCYNVSIRAIISPSLSLSLSPHHRPLQEFSLRLMLHQCLSFLIIFPSCFHHVSIMFSSRFHHFHHASISFYHDIIMSHIPVMFPQFFITSRHIQLSHSHHPYTGWLVHIPIIYSTPNKPVGINPGFLTHQQRHFPWLNSPSPKT